MAATQEIPSFSQLPTTERPGYQYDFLGEVLSSLQVANSAVVYFEFSSPWCIKIQYNLPISCTITEGGLWLSEPGQAAEYYAAGDTFLLPRGTGSEPFFVSSSQNKPSEWITAQELWDLGKFEYFESSSQTVNPQKVSWGGGGEDKVRILSFAFNWLDQCYGPLIKTLPKLMRINSDNTDSTLMDMLVKFPFTEGHPELPGFGALSSQAAQLFLVHVIRAYAFSQENNYSGWLKGFSDPKLSPVLSAIHQQPGNKWTVEGLAKLGGMSRSVFAKYFVQTMGKPPMDYLSAWRMHLARLTLSKGNVSVMSVAQSLGYQSEAAFRRAFRKEAGQNPRDYIKSFNSRDKTLQF